MEKMKRKNVLAFLLCFILMTSNMSAKILETYHAVERGMSKKEVLKILGKPENTSFDPKGELWEYFKNGGLVHYDKKIYVFFDTHNSVVSYQEITLRPEDGNNDRSPYGRQPGYFPVPAYPGESYCMSDDTYSILYRKVKAATFDDDKNTLIEVASLGLYYSGAQCAGLMKLFSFDDNKLKALRLMAPHLVDLSHVTDIYETLSYESSRKEADNIIRSYR